MPKTAMSVNLSVQERLAKIQKHLTKTHDREGVYPRDDRKTATWYQRAVQQNSTDAQYFLGMIYWVRRDVPQDDKEAA